MLEAKGHAHASGRAASKCAGIVTRKLHKRPTWQALARLRVIFLIPCGEATHLAAHVISATRRREVQPACLTVYSEATATSSCTPAGGFEGFPAGTTSAGLGHCCFPHCCFLTGSGRFAVASCFLRARFFTAIFKRWGAKKTSGTLQHASEFDATETVNF